MVRGRVLAPLEHRRGRVVNLDDQRGAKFLIHYVIALQITVLAIAFSNAWFAGFGTALMLTWIIRARRA
jgi:hypothetical protein